MLNRLFIVVGVLAILVIVAAFVVPFFIDWSSYRVRMEAIASEALGTDVRINGDIDVTLLPQPMLRFGTVIVGPEAEPLAEIASAEAEFSLMDFLRDRYAVTRLVLSEPQLYLRVDEDGQLVAPLHLPKTVSASNVSVADADIENGTVRLTDERTGEVWEATEFEGNLQVAGLRGPFTLSGQGVFTDKSYDLRLNTSAMNPEGDLQMTVFFKPVDAGFSVALEGVLKTRDQLGFAGTSVVRQSPPASDNAGGVRGDLVFTSQVEVSTNQLLFPDFVIEPDENRPATRLTGAAVVTLGVEREFDAVLSGGVVALTQRDAREEEIEGPYELVRLIGELPEPIIPPIAGRLGIDISELGLRAFSVRELRADLITDGKLWKIETLSARMPGDTEVSLAGELSAKDGAPVFNGQMQIDSTRLDALALQWRKAGENNPLFNVPGSLAGQFSLEAGKFSLGGGSFVLDGVTNGFSLNIETGADARLDLSAQLGLLGDLQSRALLALLPDIAGDNSFGVSFPSGSFDVRADGAVISDLPSEQLVAIGSWGAEGMVFEQLALAEIGGARVDVTGGVGGTLSEPVVWGKGQVSLSADAGDDSGALGTLLDLLDAPGGVRYAAGSALPVELAVELTPLNADGGQEFFARGRMGVADLDASFKLTQGILNLTRAPLQMVVDIDSGQPAALSAQLGLDAALVPENGPVHVTLQAEGTFSNSIETDLSIAGSGDKLAFSGNIIASDLEKLRGKGKLEFEISDVSPVTQLLGAEGVGFSTLSGTANLSFSGTDVISVSAIDAQMGEAFLSGELNRSVQGTDMLFTGSLRTSAIEVSALAGLLGGPSSLIPGAGIWPDGPFSVAQTPRQSRGRVRVETPFVRHEGKDLAHDAGFDLTWNATSLRIRGFEATIGGGVLGLEAGLCCAGDMFARQLSGRVTATGVDIDALLPRLSGQALGGTLEGGATFTGTGGSIDELMRSLTGEGSFSVEDFSIAQFDPSAFSRVSEVENILEVEPEVLVATVEEALKEGVFAAPGVGGVFSIAGNSVRAANLAAVSDMARVFGNVTLSLSDLGLDGSWTLTPTGRANDPSGLISNSTARVTVILSGSLLQPDHVLDLGPMIDAIRVRALENEVARLETLRAEEEERARVAAAERARLMEQRARQLAEEALARAEADAAQQARAEATQRALRQLAEELGQSDLSEELGPSQDPLVVRQGNGNAPIDLLSRSFSAPDPVFEGPAGLQSLDVTGDALTDSFN